MIFITAIFIFTNSCDLFWPKAEIYITAESYDSGTLTVVKFLEPGENSGTESNVYLDYIRTTVFNGWTWYVYEVPGGEYDVYVEMYNGSGNNNGRDRINVDAKSDLNQWAAVYFDLGSNLWGEEGGGVFCQENSQESLQHPAQRSLHWCAHR